MSDSNEMPETTQANFRGGGPRGPLPVSLQRAALPPTDDVAFWEIIQHASDSISFAKYERFMEKVCQGTELHRRLDHRLPFSRVEGYELLKHATEHFLMHHCGITEDGDEYWADLAKDASLRLETPISGGQLKCMWNDFAPDGVLPYLDAVARKFPENKCSRDYQTGDRELGAEAFGPNGADPLAHVRHRVCNFILEDRIKRPCLIELIWSYWMEEAMLVQVMNAIALRFQNRRMPGDRRGFAQLEIDPLRPLNNLLWGYIQDEQHRLSIQRRVYEYDHHYGLRLIGKAVGGFDPADSRSNFLGAFHRLLHLAARFYQQDDNTTIRADGFSLLNALKEVNLTLGEGGSNQYGDLPWVARSEMLMQQWLLARPEMREFLSSRPSAIYPEPWMERLESARALLGFGGPSVLHMYNLATMGERLLLSIRLHKWTLVNDTLAVANWARRFRSDVQGYIHAYHAVTGVDLSASAVTEHLDSRLPALLMRERRSALGR